MADSFAPDAETNPLEAFLSKAGESVPVLGAPYRKAVAYLESLSPFFSIRHAERGEGATPKTYDQALADENALMAQRAAEHPGWTTGGEVTGNLAGYMALPAASVASLPAAAATTAGVSAADKLARGGSLEDVALAGVGGGLGGAAGYAGGKLLSKALGKGADWMGIRAAGGTTGTDYRKIANVARTLELEPGGFAALGREQGIIGGAKTLPKVAERAGLASQNTKVLYGNLVDQATHAGAPVPVNDVITAIGQTSDKGLQPKYIGKAVQEAQEELAALGGDSGFVTHRQLADWLATRSAQNSGIARAIAKGDNVSGADRAFNRVYNAGREFQDSALGQVFKGAGNEARTLRRITALNRTIEDTAQNRAQMLAGQNPLGLIGSASAIAGLSQLAQGNLKAGGTLLGLALGKATGPYRANILTSALSVPQQGLERALAGGIPQVLGAQAGAELMSRERKPGAPDSFEPDPPAVAKKGP
jgi:hypothetical protein